MVELYLHSPTHLHGIKLNELIKYRDNFTYLTFAFHPLGDKENWAHCGDVLW
jgi:hypothetical protein